MWDYEEDEEFYDGGNYYDSNGDYDYGCRQYHNTQRYTPIFLAVHNGDLNRLSILLNKNNLEETVLGKRMLHVAAARGHLQIVDLLRKKGAKINAKDSGRRTPFFIALHESKFEVAEFLLKNGTCLDIPSKDSIKILNIAIARQSIQIVESLLKKSVNVNKSNYPSFWKSMDIAARVGNLEIVKLLKSNIFDKFDSKTYEYLTPLRSAVSNRHLNIVKYLLEYHGSKVNTKNSLIHLCTRDEHTDILKCLLDFGFKQNLHYNDCNLLHLSFIRGELKIWRYLLTCYSKIEAELCSQETELHSAVRANQIENVKEILNKVELKSLAEELGQFAVYIAVENGNEEILKILLEAGCSVDSCFGHNLTPLHIAATFEHTRLVEILLNHGAQINAATKGYILPLDFAATVGHFNMVKFLLASGAKPSKNRESPTLKYVLHKTKSTITPSMFQNILKITELLLIAGDLKEKNECIINDLLYTVINLRISGGNEQTSVNDNKETVNIKEKNEEFRIAIVRYILHYLEEDLLAVVVDSQLRYIYNSSIFEIISEYYDIKFLPNKFLFSENDWSDLFIVNEIEDANKLLHITQENVYSSDLFEENNKLLKLIVGRLELLAPSDKRIIEYFHSREDVTKIQKFQNECRLQIINMQKTKVVDEFNLTFYDILIKPFDIITRCIRDETLLNAIEKSYDKFPAYANFLKLRIKKAKSKIDVIDMSTNCLLHYIKGNFRIQFSRIDIEKILQYLSMGDLRKLLSAFS